MNRVVLEVKSPESGIRPVATKPPEGKIVHLSLWIKTEVARTLHQSLVVDLVNPKYVPGAEVGLEWQYGNGTKAMASDKWTGKSFVIVSDAK